MPASLSSLPFDIMHVVASSLDLNDYVHLSLTSRRHYLILQNESISRKALQRTIPYTEQGQKVRDSATRDCSSWQAIDQVYRVRESIASAQPYSASLLAYGEAFIYRQGFLCYIDGSHVRILGIHQTSRSEQVIDVLSINERVDSSSAGSLFESPSEVRVVGLWYAERVLVCLCEADVTASCWLLVIDLGSRESNWRGTSSKLRSPFRHCLSCTTKLFVRHNRSYLYYGTHSGLRADDHREWLVTGIDLKTGTPIRPQPFRLANFVGSDIASTACFEIHDGILYAVSNQTSFEIEEVDWTSYYHCIKIPLGEVAPDLKARPIWQRQHGEGPINDSWTDLSLQKDEQSNELVIVECRKEWLGGGSANVRTYYTQRLRLDEEEADVQMHDYPANDPLTRTLDEKSNPHFSQPQKRIRRHFHCEYDKTLLDPRIASTPRDFILARTKFRAYSVSAMSFLDLVSDPAPMPRSIRRRDRLRLRVASRRKKSPLIEDAQNPGTQLLRKPELDVDGAPLEGSEEDFSPTEVQLWPPDAAPPEIYDVLCPSGRVDCVEASHDERSIIYMTSPAKGASARNRAIVMISFDPKWGYPGLKKLAMPSAAGSGSREKEMKLELGVSFAPGNAAKSAPSVPSDSNPSVSASLPQIGTLKRPRCESGGQDEAPYRNGREQVMWHEEAMYLSINRGFWLR